MTIGTELDKAFINITRRLESLEDNQCTVDLDDLRCDLMSEVEEIRDLVDSRDDDLRDCLSYESDRIDDIECYKITEDEARDIALDVVRDEISDVVGDYVNDEVYELRNRVAELEARLNKPSLGARVLRWLREGPSIKEVATSWYASIRRGS